MLDKLIAPKEPMAYLLDVHAKKRPTPQDAVTASQILLDGLAHDAGISEFLNQLAPLHPRNNTFPGEVFLRLAADTLDWSGASRADPVTWRDAGAVPARVRVPWPGHAQAPVLSTVPCGLNRASTSRVARRESYASAIAAPPNT
jgi:hypothetical protein